MRIVPERRREPELLDQSATQGSYGELDGSLSELRKVNRYLGGTRAAMKHFVRMAGAANARGRKLEVLDVATGSADIPVAIVRWARAARVSVKVTAVDINPRVIEIARGHAGGYPEISFAVADGLSLPFSPGSFDIVMCSTALHHFPEDGAKTLIRRAAGLARTGYIIGDLRRSWVAFALIYAITRLMTRNRYTRYDGPLSVLKSFTGSELEDMAADAGLTSFRVTKHPFWRMALVGTAGGETPARMAAESGPVPGGGSDGQ